MCSQSIVGREVRLHFPWGKQSCRCGDVMGLKMGKFGGMAQWASCAIVCTLRERIVTDIKKAIQGHGRTSRWQDVGPQAERGWQCPTNGRHRANFFSLDHLGQWFSTCGSRPLWRGRTTLSRGSLKIVGKHRCLHYNPQQ